MVIMPFETCIITKFLLKDLEMSEKKTKYKKCSKCLQFRKRERFISNANGREGRVCKACLKGRTRQKPTSKLEYKELLVRGNISLPYCSVGGLV
jgi:hypothetical protein